jgi:hypothetical protein
MTLVKVRKKIPYVCYSCNTLHNPLPFFHINGVGMGLLLDQPTRINPTNKPQSPPVLYMVLVQKILLLVVKPDAPFAGLPNEIDC